MSGDNWQRVKAVFAEASELHPDQRPAFLDSACGGDGTIRTQVEALLAAHHEVGDFLSEPTQARLSDGQPTTELNDRLGAEKIGRRIGRYKLVERIGEGGFGSVYMAQQQEPVRRLVALKIIKLGMDTKQVIARFEAERQALAIMDHPGIAKVLDAGATESGRPYFVMDLVRGVPITDYCDQNRLSTAQRLDLFIQVCRAVQHAHQKGIIHRDLKPSNVLVTLRDSTAVPKIIDFGIAKAMQRRLTEKTLFTEFKQFVGTPAYMSPEQAQMNELDVDTRTDIYSLGVLLYELLTGTTPHDTAALRDAAFGEMQRIITEVDPPRPSTRLSTMAEEMADVARRRHTEPESLSRLVRGDLDWIVMRTLEKDRTRRYETANDLVKDIERHLNNEPVHASPPSSTYKLRKFVRRHRGAVTAGAIVAASILFGLILSTIGFVQASHDRQRARSNEERASRQAARAEAVMRFLEDTLESVDPLASARRDEITVASMLEEATRQLELGVFDHQPLVEAEVRKTLGRLYLHLHLDLDLAEQHLQEALGILEEICPRQSAGVASPGIVHRYLDLAELALERDDWEKAEALHRDALDNARSRKHKDPQITRLALRALADFLMKRGELAAEAESLYRESMNIAIASHGERSTEVARDMNDVARTLTTQKSFDEAAEVLDEALALQAELLGDVSAGAATTLFNLAELQLARGDKAGAESRYREAMEMRRALLATPVDKSDADGTHTTRYALETALSVNRNMLAHLLRESGRNAEAEALFRESLEHARLRLPPGHPRIAWALNNLALPLGALGKYDEAESVLREAVDINRTGRGNEHRDTIQSMANLGLLYFRQERFDEAAPLLLEACRWLVHAPGVDSSMRRTWLAHLVQTHERLGNTEVVERCFRQIVAANRAGHGDEQWDTIVTIAMLGSLYCRQERFQEAEPLLLEVGNWLERHADVPPQARRKMLGRLVETYQGLGNTDEAARWSARVRTP